MSGQDCASARLARLAIRCYPPSWQARYADEMLALAEDLGAGPRTAASLTLGAMGAWLRPPPHLFNRAGRIRSSVAVILAAWIALAALEMIFGQLTDNQAPPTPHHPITHAWYLIYVVLANISVGVMLLGGLPLWWSMTRQAYRSRSRADLLLLSLPVFVPVGYLAATIGITKLVRHQPGGAGIGHWWFLAFIIAGFLAAAAVAAGPSLALSRLRPAGWQLSVAMATATAGAATLAIAGLASIGELISLTLWAAPGADGIHRMTWAVICYLIAVPLAIAVAALSSARGLTAAAARQR